MSFKERIAGMNNHYRFYQLETFFKSMSLQGIRFIELWTGPMHFYIDDKGHDDVAVLLALQERYAVKIIGLCPEQTNPKPNNIATKNHQDRVYSYYEQIVDVARQLDCHQILVTSGWAYFDESREEGWKRSITMMKRIAQLAHSHNIRLMLEALQPDESTLVNTIKDLKRYLKEVDEENVYVCIDFGAMARVNECIEDYFETFKDRIQHIHFVDGNPIGHLAWGDGTRDLQHDLAILKKYQYKGYLSLESAASRYFQRPWDAEEKTMNSWEEMEGGNTCDILY